MWYSNGQVRDDSIKQRVCIACLITQATGTHSECVTLIAFPRQQWLCERSLLLRCTYFACLVNFHFVTSVCGRWSGQQLWIVWVSKVAVAVQRFELPRSVSGFVICTADCLSVWWDTQHHILVSWTQRSLLTLAHTPTHTHARTNYTHTRISHPGVLQTHCTVLWPLL